ncbi:hypothetical protein MLD38_004733 [Melastoma candidum]|uniref:Uncharacterized protein n=1 Tax=Melastoma candidum TaxID=119954 RepID=A0ACB9S651_9MYRT|nr:hypothetical protein MLD38_004733 [Melastoma candidum]
MAKIRNPRFPQRKSSSSPPLVPTIIIMVAFGTMILISIKIMSFSRNSRDSPRAVDLSSLMRDTVDRRSGGGGGENGGKGKEWVELLSWEPRAFVYHNFLSEEECQHLINLGKPYMKKSSVVDSTTGNSKDSRVRTSLGTFLTRGQDKVVRGIEKRIADFTFIPVEHGEGLQILHYEVGQKYEPHYDYFSDEYNTRNGGQRIATVLMYLSDVEEGGETVFPQAKGNSSVSWWNELSECVYMVVALLSRVTNGHRQNGCVFMSTKLELSCTIRYKTMDFHFRVSNHIFKARLLQQLAGSVTFEVSIT